MAGLLDDTLHLPQAMIGKGIDALWQSLPPEVRESWRSGARTMPQILAELSTPAAIRDTVTALGDTTRAAVEGRGWDAATNAATAATAAVGAVPGAKLVEKLGQKAAEEVIPAIEKGLLAYHGTGRTFSRFDPKFQSQGAFFFSDNKDVAFKHGGNKKVLETELGVTNPLTVEWGGGIYSKEKMDDFLRQAKDAGHDGLIVKNIKDFSGSPPTTTYAVFDPEKAKILGLQNMNTMAVPSSVATPLTSGLLSDY